MKALLAPLAELADYEEIRKNRTKETYFFEKIKSGTK